LICCNLKLVELLLGLALEHLGQERAGSGRSVLRNVKLKLLDGAARVESLRASSAFKQGQIDQSKVTKGERTLKKKAQTWYSS
jgi:hypothetical protein